MKIENVEGAKKYESMLAEQVEECKLMVCSLMENIHKRLEGEKSSMKADILAELRKEMYDEREELLNQVKREEKVRCESMILELRREERANSW